MLTRIRIENIQKHKSLTLNLDKVNVITGATDTGKTSVLRGLLWCLANNESGENLVNNDGATACSVTVTADGHEVERSWSKSKNAYRLDSKTFTTFRTSVPEPISKLLNITPLNIQERRDLPFMVYYKASECASQFSEMLDLDEIDSVITNINRAVKAKTECKDKAAGHKKTLEQSLQKYAKLDEALEAFSEIEELNAEISDLGSKIKRLTELFDRAKWALPVKSLALNPDIALTEFRIIEAMFSDYIKMHVEKCRLEALHAEIVSVYEAVANLAVANEAKRAFADVLAIAKELKALTERGRELEDLREQYARLSKFVRAEKMNYDNVHAKFVKNFPEVCPLCGGVDHEF
jgi:exonuclease SbcC